MIPVMLPLLGEEEAQAAADAVRSGWVAQGPRVAEFEQAFAAHVGAAHGVAVSSCTTALHLALHAARRRPRRRGRRAVASRSSRPPTRSRYVGATPVFADVEPADRQPQPRDGRRRCAPPRTRAVIVVHQGGVPADVDAAAGGCCDRAGSPLVEDAACAAGSTLPGPPGRRRAPRSPPGRSTRAS